MLRKMDVSPPDEDGGGSGGRRGRVVVDVDRLRRLWPPAPHGHFGGRRR